MNFIVNIFNYLFSHKLKNAKSKDENVDEKE